MKTASFRIYGGQSLRDGRNSEANMTQTNPRFVARSQWEPDGLSPLTKFMVPQKKIDEDKREITFTISTAGRDRDGDIIEQAGWILGEKVERMTFGDLTTGVRLCRGKGRDDVCRMLEPLEMFNWITPDDLNNPRAWTVNPQVHERFGRAAT